MTSQSTLIQEVQKKASSQKLPPLIKRKFHTIQDKSGPKVRILQWNILAQALSQGDDNFILCPPEALAWDNRHLHMLEEMLAYDATILCLQEVDKFQFFEAQLKSVGYTGVFFPKPDSPCLYCQKSYGPDGCAVFWKPDQIELIQQKNVILEDQHGETNQVAIVCKFKTKEGNEMYVAVTHLKAKSGFEEVRHQQGQFLVKTLEEVTGDVPLVVCGDFNAEFTEEVYKVMTSSKLGLVSSYAQLSGDGSEIPYTTWKVRGGAKGIVEHSRTIDYIWYTKEKLELNSLLMMPSVEDIGKDRLPSHTYPSDHLSLVCDFMFKK